MAVPVSSANRRKEIVQINQRGRFTVRDARPGHHELRHMQMPPNS